jgi:hypothetical protein
MSNKNGQITAVQIPIKELESINGKYPDPDSNISLPEWQKGLIDSRLSSIKKNPDRVQSIEGLMKELDRIED